MKSLHKDIKDLKKMATISWGVGKTKEILSRAEKNYNLQNIAVDGQRLPPPPEKEHFCFNGAALHLCVTFTYVVTFNLHGDSVRWSISVDSFHFIVKQTEIQKN